ncbi:MAG: alpha/beta hydrolase [Spirochaetes bacterium]|nr:alpha/beta hydrolase [Spirochaetota bacterium]
MRPRFPIVLFLGLVTLARAAAPQAQPVQGITEGRWSGRLTIKSANRAAEPLSAEVNLRILGPARGALFDIPEQSMYGYPLDEVSWSASRIHFVLDALGPDEELRFEGYYASSPLPQGGGSSSKDGLIIGTAASKSWKSSFLLRRTELPAVAGETFMEIPVNGGSLPGSLLEPSQWWGRFPLVVLFAGAGAADRNGNNYNVPGMSNSLAQIASALAARGVESFRFDKRGSGEAYVLEKGGVLPSLEELADDGAAVLRQFLKQEDHPRIIAAGMNEGAWVAAMALARLESEGLSVDGLAVMAASGESPKESLEKMLESLDEARKEEASRIVAALLTNGTVPEPSETLAEFFAPSRLAWLSSWLAVDPAKLFASVKAPILFIYGDSDLQADKPSFERLLSARPASAARLVPSMNYALKTIGSEEENYDSFTNPAFPVSTGLVDLLEAFAKAKPAPGGTTPYPGPSSR